MAFSSAPTLGLGTRSSLPANRNNQDSILLQTRKLAGDAVVVEGPGVAGLALAERSGRHRAPQRNSGTNPFGSSSFAIRHNPVHLDHRHT